MVATLKAVRTLLVVGAGSALVALTGCSETPTQEESVNVDVDRDTAQPATCVGDCKTPPLYTSCYPLISLKDNPYKLAGNTRLTRIVASGDNWLVEAAYNDDLTKRGRYPLKPTNAIWVRDTNGQLWAQVGQAAGTADEATVVSPAQIVRDRTGKIVSINVPCIEPQKQDSAGYYVDDTLADSCVVETNQSGSNATGLQVDNYATREVCGSANYDGAPNTGGCFMREGAGMNDINGTERDINNVYMPSGDRCHHMLINGAVNVAAKRPNVKLGVVEKGSPIIWRGVLNNVKIAN